MRKQEAAPVPVAKEASAPAPISPGPLHQSQEREGRGSRGALFLQGRAGNEATSRVVQRALTVGRADDPAEREADAVAADVMRFLTQPAAPFDRERAGDRLISRRMRSRLDRAADPALSAGGPLDEAHQAAIDRTRAHGKALPPELRANMESAFGADFGRVRVHEDGESNRLSREIGARAFTTGNDIFFGRDAYRPAATDGRRLLAHELTHVVQQGAAPRRHQAKEGVIHRLVSAGRFQVVTASPTRAQTAVLPTIDTLLQQYAGANGPGAQLDCLDQIEHAVYTYFDTARAQGNKALFKRELYWLLDQVQREHHALTALSTQQGGAVWTSDAPSVTDATDISNTWNQLQGGTGKVFIDSAFKSHSGTFEHHPEYKNEMMAAFARLLSRPYGRKLVIDVVGTAAVGAQAPVTQLGPQSRAKVQDAKPSPAETSPMNADQAKMTRGQDQWTKGAGSESTMRIDSMSDTEWQVHSASGKQILAPAFIVLGHELVHAKNNDKGMNLRDEVHTGAMADWVNVEEERTINEENKIRAEHGLTARAKHTKTEKGKRDARVAGSLTFDLAALQAGSPFTKANFIPQSKNGIFDVQLDIQSKEIRITLKIDLQLVSVSTGDRREKAWTKKEADQWVVDFKKAITTQWENKFAFVLQHPDQPAPVLTITPKFCLNAGYTLMQEVKHDVDQALTPQGPGTGPATPHYKTTVYHGKGLEEYTKDSVMGAYARGKTHAAQAVAIGATKDARVAIDAIAAGGTSGEVFLFKGNAKFDKHNREMLNFITTEERQALKRYLKSGASGQRAITFTNTGNISMNDQAALTEFAKLVEGSYPKLVLDYPLIIRGSKTNAGKVKAFLTGLNLPNRLKVKSDSKITGAILELDPDYKASTKTKDKVGRQITVNHEFGHMLGVPDDYVGMSPAAKTKFQNYRFVGDGLDLTAQPEYDVKAPGPPTAELQYAQEHFIDLCERAGVPIPMSFGMKTNALMGSGDEMLPHYYATVWEALTMLVAPITPEKWWKIRPV